MFRAYVGNCSQLGPNYTAMNFIILLHPPSLAYRVCRRTGKQKIMLQKHLGIP